MTSQIFTFLCGIGVPILNDPLDERDNMMHIVRDS